MMHEDQPVDGLVFYEEAKFNASLKGIIDIQGRLTEPFSLVIAMERRNTSYDHDYTKYSNYLALNVDRDKAWFSVKKSGMIENIHDLTEVLENETCLGLESDVITTYWLSYDRDNMIIKYGKGYAMVETTLMICDFSKRGKREWSMFFSIYHPDRNGVSLLLYRSSLDIEKKLCKAVAPGNNAGFIHVEPLIEVRKEPLVVNPSPFVMDASKVMNLNLIEKNQYTFSSELPAPCKILYETIENIELDIEYELGDMDMRLSDAIRYSMTTQGCLLHEKLKSKSYLRITIGPSARQSPGIPYVLEFWPPGAVSPVHNHSSACAIIKVLYGTIQNGTYNKMPSTVYDTETFQPKELFHFDCHQGDVLWMSPKWYQTHQLRNVSEDFCATLNCYRYDEDDPIQYPDFDYVNNANGQMENFFPNTDFSFGEMRRIVLKEWDARHKTKPGWDFESEMEIDLYVLDKLDAIEKAQKMMKISAMVVISSMGGAAQRHGGALGQYEYDEMKGYYQQTSTEQGDERYLYHDEDDKWWVSSTPGEMRGVLLNPSPSKTVPTSGWQYADNGTFHDDPTLTISPGPLSPLARQFTVTATGAAAKRYPDFLGVFTRSERWCNGRPVYINNQGRLLRHGAGDWGWMIGRALCKGALSGSRAHHSPDSERNWRYLTWSGWKPASVTVTASD